MQLAVYGNLIKDRILILNRELDQESSNECTHSYDRAGGIANFCRAFAESPALSKCGILVTAVSSVGTDEEGQYLVNEMNNLCDTCFAMPPNSKSSKATVICSPNNRLGIVEWGICSTNDWEPIKADWHHLMYADYMLITDKHLDKIRSSGGIISIDITDNGLEKVRPILDKVDYIFYGGDYDHVGYEDLVREAFIAHTPSHIYVKHKDSMTAYRNELLPNLNVLGAGDYLAAHCIASMMLNRQANESQLIEDLWQTDKVQFLDLRWASDNTLQMLKDQTCKLTSSSQ